MLKISELTFGFSDAENYKRRENKELLNKLFIHTTSLDKLCEKSTFFLIGEKGTGKTAYALYLANNNYSNIYACINYIRETEYQKFIELKTSKHLSLSDYSNIWKVIIYLLISQHLLKEKIYNTLLDKYLKLRQLKKVIDEYYENAFAPEIIYAIRFVEDSKLAAELMAKHATVNLQQGKQKTFDKSNFQNNLLYIQKQFEEVLTSVKLKNDHILFIDGIDIRPSLVPYEEYLLCIKGLANAIWSINNDFFPAIRDSNGRIRVVLLVRPDIFDSIGLQNINNKIRDNSVLLDWRTTYPEYRTSAIFNLADRLLSYNQPVQTKPGDSWDYYFPYDASNVRKKEGNKPNSFIEFLRYSYYRPRDIVTMLSLLKENYIEQRKNKSNIFSESDFAHPDFRHKLSDYLLGEVKDHLAFYYSNNDYEVF